MSIFVLNSGTTTKNQRMQPEGIIFFCPLLIHIVFVYYCLLHIRFYVLHFQSNSMAPSKSAQAAGCGTQARAANDGMGRHGRRWKRIIAEKMTMHCRPFVVIFVHCLRADM